MGFRLAARRGVYLEVDSDTGPVAALGPEVVEHLESLDLIYRSLCAVLYNYVPQSGHPGGSISSGRVVSSLLFETMDYDLSAPSREDADVISFAAGHKALGLYAIWALRDEVARIAAPQLLPADVRNRLRLEDLLGFRRNPVTETPLFRRFGAKALDGHPTPATPFVRLSTGASGVGIASSLGLALGLRDYFGSSAPRVHVIEGEGGLTPGRVAEALAAAGTMSLDNVVVHVDWNQSSIDSDRVCREGSEPGEYVQWNPMELFQLNDWNVVYVPEGRDLGVVLAAQRQALAIDNGQPTAMVYRTVKGWNYGIEGRASHGAGHKLCSDGFYLALEPLTERVQLHLPHCEEGERRCEGDDDGRATMEACMWEALGCVRRALEQQGEMTTWLADQLTDSQRRIDALRRKPRAGAPRLDAVYELAAADVRRMHDSVGMPAGSSTTLRAALGSALGRYNEASGGAIFAAAADLLGSTSVDLCAGSCASGYYNTRSNPDARLMSVGGICEDAISGFCGGLSTGGRHLGVASSYGAFIAPLGHVAARLHAIGAQARRETTGRAYDPIILICAHAGLKTGEDGPTHADPQPLQLLQENFPAGAMITLTPWDPREVPLLLAAALSARPAVIAPFVTRPNEIVLDRDRMGLASATEAHKGVYRLVDGGSGADVVLVLQGSEVTYEFIERALPRLRADGLRPDVYYVASAELFDRLDSQERESVFPSEKAAVAMGITGFTLPTMYRWIRSSAGIAATIHPYRKGRYLGSGHGRFVLQEAGLDGETQYLAIRQYLARAA